MLTSTSNLVAMGILGQSNFLLHQPTYIKKTQKENFANAKEQTEKVLEPLCPDFLTPIPCTYTSSPLDGSARNYYLIYLPRCARARNLLSLDPWIH